MLTYLWKLTHKQRKSAKRLSSIWKGIFTQSFIGRNSIIRNLRQIQLANYEKNNFMLSAQWDSKTYYLSKLLCICPFLLKKTLIKSRIWHLQKSPTSYSTKGSHFGTSPLGGLYLEGRFNRGIFALRVWGAYIWKGLIHGGAYFRNFTVYYYVYYYYYYCYYYYYYYYCYYYTHPIFCTLYIRPVSNVILLPCRAQLIELYSTLAWQ